jgi:hypothetical protein
VGMAATAGAASATTLTEPMTFECYHGVAASINGGNLRADKLVVADDGRTTGWYPVVYQWNASSRQWLVDAVGYVQTFTDSALGELMTDSPENFNVATNHYYAVKYFMKSVGDSAVQAGWAQAMTGGAPIGSSTCLT